MQVRKKGDAQRILLMNMVKVGPRPPYLLQTRVAGGDSDDRGGHEARGGQGRRRQRPPDVRVRVRRARGQDLQFWGAASHHIALADSAAGVYKINRLKGSQRRILQFDFQTRVLCTIQNGHRTNPIPYDQIDRVEGDVRSIGVDSSSSA